MLEIDLPWPPSVNHYWRSVPGKGVLISEEGRFYRAEVADQVLIQRAGKRLAGRLRVNIQAYPPDRRRRDLDNMLKAILDSLTHAGVWLDDQQIDDLRIVRRDLGGRVVVGVSEVVARGAPSATAA